MNLGEKEAAPARTMVMKGQSAEPASGHAAAGAAQHGETESCSSPAPTSSSLGRPLGAEARALTEPQKMGHVPQKPTCMWLLSCFFTSGWIHSCSREPSTHTLGLAEERTMGSKNQRAIAPVPSSSISMGCVEPTGSTGRHGSHVHPGSQREWPWPEWALGLGGAFSTAWPSVNKETRQGKQADGRRPR